jgi:hypothetical protein
MKRQQSVSQGLRHSNEKVNGPPECEHQANLVQILISLPTSDCYGLLGFRGNRQRSARERPLLNHLTIERRRLDGNHFDIGTGKLNRKAERIKSSNLEPTVADQSSTSITLKSKTDDSAFQTGWET